MFFRINLHGVESWTLTETTTIRLEAIEMWLRSRMLIIPIDSSHNKHRSSQKNEKRFRNIVIV